jgi:hypothetical protein
MKVSDQLHAPDGFTSGEDPRYPLGRRLGGPEPVWTRARGKKIPTTADYFLKKSSLHDYIPTGVKMLGTGKCSILAWTMKKT